MSFHRLIPCVLIKNGLVVRSEGFRIHQSIGTPISTISRLSNWNVDELVLVDISSDDIHDRRRDDHAVRYDDDSIIGLLRHISDISFMPVSFGGGIRSLDDIRVRLAAGADKCIINSQAVRDPDFIAEAADRFGSQCIVVSIDAKRQEDGRLEVYSEHGTKATGMTPAEWAKRVEALGAGEIFLNSIDRDGIGTGYDLELVRSVTDAVSISVIACGGVGRYEDFAPGVQEGGAAAVSAANIFHFFELSYPYAKQACLDAGVVMRSVGLNSSWFKREPEYDHAQEAALLEERMTRARTNPGPKKVLAQKPEIRWCKKCVYPSVAASYLEFDEDGLCTGCRTSGERNVMTPEMWDMRKERLIEILEAAKCRDGSRHDCVIGVSGGKDSYFQVHYIKNVLGYNPLLVTYYGNAYTAAGQRNLLRMKEVFGVDHLIVQPSVEVLKKLNRLAFKVMGDMNWHNHVGIMTVPIRAAVQNRIPLIIWGEHGEMDLSGQFSMNDFLEFTYRNRLEHDARGYEWNYMIGFEGLTPSDMISWQYPSDDEIFDLGLRGIYLGNYVYWDGETHGRDMVERYGFEPSDVPFERTYRRLSNLDDMHENGVHDYLKYVKFGYGRGTDHATKDIRSGKMTREEGVEMVRRYDHVKSSDLYHWLEYVGMSEAEFDAIADTFRDPRVWHKEDGEWVKDCMWD